MNIRRTLLALVPALALSLGLALAPPAHAATHNCSEGSINEPTGTIVIVDTTGGCNLGSLNAGGGNISITSNGPVTIAGPVTALTDINVSATGALQIGAGQLSSSTGSIGLSATTTITVNGVSNFATAFGLYSQNGGNIHVVGAITGAAGSGSASIISDIGGAGTITLDSSITAGFVEMQANGNIQVTGALNSQTVGSHVDIKTMAAGGTIKLDGNVTAPGQVVELVAFGNISTKTIDTTSTTTGTGDVRIIANKVASGTIPVFVIGGTGNSNGVNGSIITNTQSAGGQGTQTTKHSVAIVNGGATATGGITVVNGTNISVAATASRAGCILLDAKNGPFTLQAGALSANGAAGQSAGCINVAANTITLGSNASLTANDDGTKGYNHYVSIAASQVSVTGTVNLQADGKGIDTTYPAAVLLLAKGSLSWTVPEDYSFPNPVPTRTDVATTLTVNGSGSLVLRANGAINRVEVVAKPITFSNTGTLTITANGASPNNVHLRNPGSNTNVTGLSFTGGNVTIRADGVSGVGDAAGGYVEIFGDQMTLNANTFTFSANGPSAGDGNGGRFYFSSTAATLKSTGKVTVTANAASAGTGDAILGAIGTGDPKAIQFFPGSVSVDVGTASGVGQYSFAAKGGGTSGKGGTIYMGAPTMTLKTANAINAAALAGNSDGGEIYLNNYITLDPSATVTAIGKGTGKGGKFTAFHNIIDIDILKYVKVDGGTTVSTTQLNGSIRLNGIWCRQWRLTGGQSWPKTHWVCTDQSDNPSAPAALSLNTAAADVAKSTAFNGLRALLNDSTHKVNIFVFSGSANFNTFWNEVLPAKSGGLTFKIPATSTNIYLNPWQSGSVGADAVVDPYSYNQAKEVAAHELGHAVDIAFKGAGATLPSNDTNWGSNKTRDTIIDLDTVLDPVTFTQYHRFPCKVTPLDAGHVSGTPPLAGVTDVRNGVPACLANGDVNDAMLTGGATWTQSTVTATQVLSLIEQGLFQAPPELHAQTFAWSAVGSQTARPMFDQVMDNGFFPCIKAWANAEKAGSLPTTGSCTAPLTH